MTSDPTTKPRIQALALPPTSPQSLHWSRLRAGSDQSMLADYPLVYLPQNLPNIFVMKVAGEIAAEVPYLPRPLRYGQSGSNATVPIDLPIPMLARGGKRACG
jgi:hypothetical protein